MKKHELIIHQNLNKIPNFEIIFNKHEAQTLIEISVTKDMLSQATITTINNQIQHHTIIDTRSGIFYFRIKGIHHILRTTKGLANTLIRKGVPNILSATTQIIEYESKEYISQTDLQSIFSYCQDVSKDKRTIYLKYTQTYTNMLKDLEYTKNLKRVMMDNIAKRTKLKKTKIKQENITKCQFSDKVFSDDSEVEYAHIDAVAYRPDMASDLRNGVIILKEIHEELTRLEIYTFEAMYAFCEENNYRLEWAKQVTW